MDDKGFIFTVDATLALVVVMVLTVSVMAYVMVPAYQGEDHQHLEALADSVLETMEQSGQLRADAVYYSSGNATLIKKANDDLNSTLGALIPSGIAYKITMNTGTSYEVRNDRNLLTSSDVVTKVKVISGPQEGWMGRAYYKLEEVKFYQDDETQITTLWNFHNWLQNFDPWDAGLNSYKLWGGDNPSTSSKQVAKNISFYVNSTGINSAKFLVGAADDVSSNPSAYGANFILNGNNKKHNITSAGFGSYIYKGDAGYMYNYLGNIAGSELNSGTNNYYINFTAKDTYQHLPWFSIIGNYNTSMLMPLGAVTSRTDFPDIAGVGKGSGSIQYYLDTGTMTTFTGKSLNWNNDIKTKDIDTSKPFTITGLTGTATTGSAVASVCNVYLPPGSRLFDAYTVINPYGGVDRAIVQVKNSKGTWQTIFTSFDYTQRTDGGYGNLPGILNIAPYLTEGNNQVRIIIWDDVGSGDYDLVGLTNCYSEIKYSQLPIRWDTFPFSNMQYSSVTTQTRDFNIETEAQEALLFVGTGLDTENITVTIKNRTSSTTSTLYNGSVPYSLDLGNLDARSTQTNHIITQNISANGSYQLKPGNYTLSVTVTPGLAYESGDFGGNGRSTPVSINTVANPEIFSGTRISVIYPKFLSNVWASAFAATPEEAKNNATGNLINNLTGYEINTSQIKSEALYSGDVPNSISVRLELWKQ